MECVLRLNTPTVDILSGVLIMAATNSEVEQLFRAFAETTNDRDFDRLPEIVSDDFVWRTPGAPGGEVHGPAAAREVMEGITTGFPDFHVEPGDVFVDGKEGMTTIRITGTHEAEFMDIPATNEEVELVGMSKLRVANGKLQKLHDVVNMQELLEQLGVAEG